MSLSLLQYGMRKEFILTIILFILNNDLSAQKETVNGNQQWIQYYSTIMLSNNFGLYSDLGLRWKDGFSEISQTLVRGGLGYHPKKNVKLLVGFAFLTLLRNKEFERFEYRPYQEVSITHPLGKIRLQHRFRVEERFFKSVGDDPGIRNSFNYRFRYRLFGTIQLSNSDLNRWSINLGNEILINAGGDVARNIFDSNRLLIGPVFKLTPNLDTSFTYNYTIAKRNQGEARANAHIFWLGVKHRLSLID